MVTTVNDAYLDVRKAFRKAGIAGSDIEARELLCKVLDMDENSFYRKRSACAAFLSGKVIWAGQFAGR